MKHFVKTMLVTPILIISTIIVVGLNIPIARQIVGFACISFMPGFLILKILRIDLKSGVNTILFSVGLSVAFLMFVGLLVNELFPLLGVSKPLSTLPLLVSISAILLAMSLLSLRRDDLAHVCSFPSPGQVFRASLLIGVPLLAIFGALLVNSFVLLLMVVAIAVLTILTIFSKKLIPPNLYPFLLLVIAVSLLFHKEFISKYLMGWDIFTENFLVRLTKSDSLWNAAIPFTEIQISNYNSIVSVTILPTLYSNLLNVQGEWVLKVVYVLFFSLVPIILYQTYHQRFGKLTAFLSMFYFILFPRFYGLASRRQMIAGLFFALLIFLMINKNMKPRKRQILSIIFGVALVVSHYSIAYIYLFYVFLTWFSMTIMEKHWFTKWNLKPRKTITGGFVLLFFFITFSWYVYVSTSPLKTLSGLVTHISKSFFIDFLNPEARGTISKAIAPAHITSSSVQVIDFVINKFPYFFILIGIIYLFRNYKQKEFDWEYGLMVTASAFIVLLVIVVPRLAPAFEADRFYHVTLFYLAPVCILGGKAFFEFTLRPFARAHVKPSKNIMHVSASGLRPLCIFLAILFLFNVGFIQEVVRDVPTSRSISFMRMKTSNNNETKAIFYNGYTPEQDVFSAIWLSKMAGNNSKIYADFVASHQVLRGYGMIIVERKYYLSSDVTIENGSYIYLQSLNVEGIFITKERARKIEFIDLPQVINNANKIYSNGASEIYRSLPDDQ